MSEEIKLGWYRSRIVESEHEEVVYATSTQVVIRSQAEYMFILSANSIRDHYEYLGPELPQQGEWVDIDLSKVTLADLPIKARFRHNAEEYWTGEMELVAFTSDNGSYPFLCKDNTDWRFCQVWRPL